MPAPATYALATRLIASLMTLIRAVADVAKGAATPTFDELTAGLFFTRLARLVASLVGIATANRHAAQPKVAEPVTPFRTGAGSTSAGTGAFRDMTLPRRSGWLLDALPNLAPAVAGELALILADPAFPDLLDANPALRRTLLPLLRSLGLSLPSPSLPDIPPPCTPAPDRPLSFPQHPAPTPSGPATSSHPKSTRRATGLSHAQYITIT